MIFNMVKEPSMPDIVTWGGGTDEQIVKMVEAADKGKINLADYWSVGDEREIQISEIASGWAEDASISGGEAQPAQTVTLVLVNAGGKTLQTPTKSGRTECSFIWHLKDSLYNTGVINRYSTTPISWDEVVRRRWCNEIFYMALPEYIQNITKVVLNKTNYGKDSYPYTARINTYDLCALPSYGEIITNTDSAYAGNSWTYYETKANRIKILPSTGRAHNWWTRSPHWSSEYDTQQQYYIGTTGSKDETPVSSTEGLAPFGCI